MAEASNNMIERFIAIQDLGRRGQDKEGLVLGRDFSAQYQPSNNYFFQVLPEQDAWAPAPLPVFFPAVLPSIRISQLTAPALSL